MLRVGQDGHAQARFKLGAKRSKQKAQAELASMEIFDRHKPFDNCLE